MTTRVVTERDFRMPEFLDAKVEDYEFREDGKLVRKDRWETGVNSIRNAVYHLLPNPREWEIPDVIDAVHRLVEENKDWESVEEEVDAYLPDPGVRVQVQLSDGSKLRNVEFNREQNQWLWFMPNGVTVILSHISYWKEMPPENESIAGGVTK